MDIYEKIIHTAMFPFLLAAYLISFIMVFPFIIYLLITKQPVHMMAYKEFLEGLGDL